MKKVFLFFILFLVNSFIKSSDVKFLGEQIDVQLNEKNIRDVSKRIRESLRSVFEESKFLNLKRHIDAKLIRSEIRKISNKKDIRRILRGFLTAIHVETDLFKSQQQSKLIETFYQAISLDDLHKTDQYLIGLLSNLIAAKIIEERTLNKVPTSCIIL